MAERIWYGTLVVLAALMLFFINKGRMPARFGMVFNALLVAAMICGPFLFDPPEFPMREIAQICLSVVLGLLLAPFIWNSPLHNGGDK